MAEKRAYNKKDNDYWNNIVKKPAQVPAIEKPIVASRKQPVLQFDTYGENIMASFAQTGNEGTRYKGTNSEYSNGLGGYENLNQFPMPYEVSNGRLSINTAIRLIMRAYSGFAVFRNAIEVLVEFSNTKLHIKGGNAQSREFVAAFLEKIQIDRLKEAFFREYYRSGNVLMVRFDGKMRQDDLDAAREVLGAKNPTIPISYVILNPVNIFVENGIIPNRFTYTKLLSTFEIERLKFPKTVEEQEMFNDLPEVTQKQIKSWTGGLNAQIYIPIDPNRLHFVFYKKQPYEPLAVPMGFAVLPDIEWKLQLKRVDMAMTRSLEHAMLLVTNGEKIDENGNGGIVPENLRSIQEIFKKPTIGRVFVADYTTDAKWVIPDFKELLGPEKYTIVDKDIKEGLQSILIGEDKFANAIVKARIFQERLKEGQRALLRDFLIPEIKRVCAQMNFKKIPTLEFEDVSLEDQTNIHKMYTRWAELGILTPWELTRAKETGLLPDKDANLESQKEYKELRDKEYYYPLTGASSSKDGGRPDGSTSPKTVTNVGVMGSDVKFSAKKLATNVYASNMLKENVIAAFKQKAKVKKLSEELLELANSVSKSIMVNEDVKDWSGKIKDYISSPKEIAKETAQKIDDLRIEHDISELDAILMYKSAI